jgi:hypothetical protein
MTDVSITTRGLNEAVQRLRAADAVVQKEFRVALTEAAAPFIKAARANASSRLPHRGGLAALVAASEFEVVPLHGRGVAGLRVTNRAHDKRIDKGQLRHPVWGHWRSIASQPVPPGWFSDAGPQATPAIRRLMLAATSRVAKKVAG